MSLQYIFFGACGSHQCYLGSSGEHRSGLPEAERRRAERSVRQPGFLEGLKKTRGERFLAKGDGLISEDHAAQACRAETSDREKLLKRGVGPPTFRNQYGNKDICSLLGP